MERVKTNEWVRGREHRGQTEWMKDECREFHVSSGNGLNFAPSWDIMFLFFNLSCIACGWTLTISQQKHQQEVVVVCISMYVYIFVSWQQGNKETRRRRMMTWVRAKWRREERVTATTSQITLERSSKRDEMQPGLIVTIGNREKEGKDQKWRWWVREIDWQSYQLCTKLL